MSEARFEANPSLPARLLNRLRAAAGKLCFFLGLKLCFELSERDPALGLAPHGEAVVLGPLEPLVFQRGDPVSGVVPVIQPNHQTGLRAAGNLFALELLQKSKLSKERLSFVVVGSGHGFVWVVGKVHAASVPGGASAAKFSVN